MDAVARVSSKGQVTIPRAVREALGIKQGDAVLFRVEGERVVFSRIPDLMEIGGVTGWLRAMGQAEAAAVPVSSVDTNVLVRYLTGDPPELAQRAKRYLEREENLILPDLIVAEIAYVLTSYYQYDRAQVAIALRTAVTRPALQVSNLDLLVRTVELYETHRVDFADAYLIASAEAAGVGAVASFDRDIERAGTVVRVEPT